MMRLLPRFVVPALARVVVVQAEGTYAERLRLKPGLRTFIQVSLLRVLSPTVTLPA
jgi:hypothetical protein